MSIENAIQEIIKKIKLGKIFDSHHVISRLISDYSNEYLIFASELINSPKAKKTKNVTALVHSQISKKIGASGLVTRAKSNGKKEEFLSDNIRKKPSKCAGWRKK